MLVLKLNIGVWNVILHFATKTSWNCLATGKDKIDNCANSCIINVLDMRVLMLYQRNISYFKCRIFWKQKLLCEFREFLVISRKSVANFLFWAFSVFVSFCFNNLKLICHSLVDIIHIKLRLTYCSCFYSQRSVFCSTEIKSKIKSKMKSMWLKIVWELVIRESLYTGIIYIFHDLRKFIYMKPSIFMIPKVKKFCKWFDSRTFLYSKYYNFLKSKARWFFQITISGCNNYSPWEASTNRKFS